MAEILWILALIGIAAVFGFWPAVLVVAFLVITAAIMDN